MPSSKPTLGPLKTPKSAPLPSELPRSPLHAFTGFIKTEDGIKTPITPPTAYLDFLKALSPAISSPSSSEKSNDKSGKSTPTSQPSSASSTCSCNCEAHKSPKIIIPPSPHARPMSARPMSAKTPTHLRRLRIPQSPISPGVDSPLSTTSMVFSARSPQDWDLDGKSRYFDDIRMGTTRPVSVRQVVTRTVTYTRTPLEPAPKGKRRKVE
ncbi:MAG: hypothetical protein M1819_006302 [Sarea resinae]|nr:MAG: hypothetical protein M1819_006302 [Sarea resinae]